jgi:predicted XRE-type DNA-binding protein
MDTNPKPTNALIKEITRQLSENGMSQAELAEDLAISTALLSMILNDYHQAQFSLIHLKTIIRHPKFNAQNLLKIICGWAGCVPSRVPVVGIGAGSATADLCDLLKEVAKAVEDGKYTTDEAAKVEAQMLRAIGSIKAMRVNGGLK